ncbi:MAG TPA: ABC transporter permease [Ktedonobacterales bacterium]
MGRYIVRRLAQAVFMLFALSIVLFLLLYLIPGGPQAVLFNPRLGAAARNALAAKYGLDRPLPLQYVSYMQHLFQGDLDSFNTGRPVQVEIGDRLPYTLQLFALSLTFAVAIALLLGVISAIRQYSITDYAATISAYFGIAMPVFFIALILQYLFGVVLQPFFLTVLGTSWPVFGISNSDASTYAPLQAIGDRLQHLVLPTIALSLIFIASWSRYLRSSMLDTVKQDFIRTARAKGLSGGAIFFRHALRNALIPFITVVAIDFAGFAGGAVITETVFALPGIGKLFYDALGARDYPVLLTLLLFAAVVVVFFNLVADLLYAVLDPRITYS